MTFIKTIDRMTNFVSKINNLIAKPVLYDWDDQYQVAG